MVSTDTLHTILESETDLHWTVKTDRHDLKKFVAVSFEYTVEYISDKDKWRFSFDDMATKESSALGPISTEDLDKEFRDFVRETKQ